MKPGASDRAVAHVPAPLQPHFAAELIAWQRRAGRHGLPWQDTHDPYRVWLSEIMLQQTQVSTVLRYYPVFLQRFPDVLSLAQAQADEVMALWSGLGYYSRARNLHRCAQVVVQQHGGRFPDNAAALQTLPGVGASTAAAIAAFSFNERVSILDGNVRRLLARVLAFGGDLAQAGAARALWQAAQALPPNHPQPGDMSAYTQGLMDLGATVCTRSRPRCEQCPMASVCVAHKTGTVERYPVKTRTLKRRHESWWLLLCVHWASPGGPSVWLARRPATGIWANLHCPPVFDSLDAAVAALQPTGPAASPEYRALVPVQHSLTHRELRLHPLLVECNAPTVAPADEAGRWLPLDQLDSVGLPAPVRLLLNQLATAAPT